MPLAERAWIRISGKDRVRWLNGMVTNSIVALGPGDGCTTFLLNAQGRIQGTGFVFAEPEALLLETDCGQVETLLALLDRFIIMDDVELGAPGMDGEGVVVVGPGAEALLGGLGLLAASVAEAPAAAGETPALRAAEMLWQGEPVRVQRMAGRLAPRFELWAERAAMDRLQAALEDGGAIAGDAQSLEWLRVLEGTPRFGQDIRERELPQETGQTEALHFNKGCYLGQEIVERIRSRGAVHRTFSGFRLAGEAVAVGAAILAGGKAVGELTSVVELPAVGALAAGLRLGLGYVRREALDAGQALTCGDGVAEAAPLPFHVAEAP